MVAPIEYRFKINAYTPQTMPLDRLAKYLNLLASIMGQPQSVHLIGVEGGSTVPVLAVDWEDDTKVRQRVHDAGHGKGPQEAVAAKNALEDYLAQDNAEGATLTRSGENILQFRPHVKPREAMEFGPFDQPGSLDGVVARVP